MNTCCIEAQSFAASSVGSVSLGQRTERRQGQTLQAIWGRRLSPLACTPWSSAPTRGRSPYQLRLRGEKERR